MVNLLDAPGHPDFVGELRAGIRSADAGIFVVSAADGIDGAAQALWDECRDANLPRVIVLTKLDRGHADFDTSVEDCQAAFGEGVKQNYISLAMSLPSYFGSGTYAQPGADSAERGRPPAWNDACPPTFSWQREMRSIN